MEFFATLVDGKTTLTNVKRRSIIDGFLYIYIQLTYKHTSETSKYIKLANEQNLQLQGNISNKKIVNHFWGRNFPRVIFRGVNFLGQNFWGPLFRGVFFQEAFFRTPLLVYIKILFPNVSVISSCRKRLFQIWQKVASNYASSIKLWQ